MLSYLPFSHVINRKITGVSKFGSFAEYVVADGALAIRLPTSWTFEDAAQLGVASITTALSLYHDQKLSTPLEPASSPIDILVWGGSTSVGQFVVQCSRQANLRVIATCSPKNFELVKSLGANEVLDYRDAETSVKIRELTSGKLRNVVDCYAEGDTGEKIERAIGDEGGLVTVLVPYESKRKDVRNRFTGGLVVLGKVSTCNLPYDPCPTHSDCSRRRFLINNLLTQKCINSVFGHPSYSVICLQAEH